MMKKYTRTTIILSTIITIKVMTDLTNKYNLRLYFISNYLLI